MLSDTACKNLKGAAFSPLTDFAMTTPAFVSVLLIMQAIQLFTGGAISWTKMWLYIGAGIVGAMLVHAYNRYAYKKTRIAPEDGERKYPRGSAEQIHLWRVWHTLRNASAK